MNEEHNRIVKAFEDGGLKFTPRQKEIAGEAYDKVMKKHHGICEQCGDVADFHIYNVKKDELMFFCALHFWKFCKIMADSYKQMQIAVKDIDKMMGN